MNFAGEILGFCFETLIEMVSSNFIVRLANILLFKRAELINNREANKVGTAATKSFVLHQNYHNHNHSLTFFTLVGTLLPKYIKKNLQRTKITYL
jgi:hypothetical protein